MNFKITGILALFLTLGIVAVIFLNKQEKQKDETKKTEEKLLNIEKEQVTDIYLQPSAIHCQKDSAVGWKILSPIQTDGDKSAIDGLLGMFSYAKIERTVSSDPAEYSTYGLHDGAARMVLTHQKGTDTLYVGDSSPTGSFVFARKSGSPDVFLTSTTLQSNVKKTLFDLRNKSVLGFETAQVRSLHLQNQHGEFELVKNGADWSLEKPTNQAADKTEVDKVINRLNSERAKEYVDENPTDLKPYGLDRPLLRVDLALGENMARKTLFIGKAKESQFYARDDARTPVFLVDSAFVNVLNPTLFDLRNKKLTTAIASDITRFELEFSGETIVCNKDTSGVWSIEKPEPRKAKSWKMSSITREAAELKVAAFVDDAPKSLSTYGLINPQVNAKFYKDNQLLMNIQLGKVDGENVYAKLSDKPSVYLVGKSVLETWMPKLDDIAELPETAQVHEPSSAQ